MITTIPAFRPTERSSPPKRSTLFSKQSVPPAANPDDLQAVPLMSHQPIYRWNWMPDGKLILPQGDVIRLVSPAGGESVLLSNDKWIPAEALSCGKYVVFRAIPRTGGASVNLWRMDTAGVTQLTFGRNEQSLQCSPDGKWVYYLALQENQGLKRVPV